MGIYFEHVVARWMEVLFQGDCELLQHWRGFAFLVLLDVMQRSSVPPFSYPL